MSLVPIFICAALGALLGGVVYALNATTDNRLSLRWLIIFGAITGAGLATCAQWFGAQ